MRRRSKSGKSVVGTDADDDLSKKRQRVYPGQQICQLKKTKKDEADDDVEDVGEVAKAKEDRARLEGRLEERGDILKVLREATIRTAPPTAGTVVGDYYMDDHEGFQFPPLGSFSSAVKKKKIPKVTGADKVALGRPNQVLMRMDG